MSNTVDKRLFGIEGEKWVKGVGEIRGIGVGWHSLGNGGKICEKKIGPLGGTLIGKRTCHRA